MRSAARLATQVGEGATQDGAAIRGAINENIGTRGRVVIKGRINIINNFAEIAYFLAEILRIFIKIINSFAKPIYIPIEVIKGGVIKKGGVIIKSGINSGVGTKGTALVVRRGATRPKTSTGNNKIITTALNGRVVG